MADSKRYSEREVAEILRLASEHQPLASSEGLSLAEIKSVASELGLDVTAIEAASRVVDTGGSTKTSDGTQFEYSRSFHGELSEDGWEELIAKLRRKTGLQGTMTERGATREWAAAGEFRSTFLTATTRDGVTRFRLYTESGNFIAFAWVMSAIPLVMGGALTAAFIKKGAPMPLMLGLYALLAVAMIFLVSRSIANRRRQSRGFSELLDDLEPFMQSPAPISETQVATVEDPLRVRLGS